MARYFTHEEAKQMLPIIRPLIEKIMAIRNDILARQPEMSVLLEKIGKNGGNQELSKIDQEFQTLERLVSQIQEIGIVVKDINLGLVDFPSIREGREVYLCWRYGEDTIQYWHEIDAGFAGRQLI